MLIAECFRFKGVTDGAGQAKPPVGSQQMRKIFLYVEVILNQNDMDHRLSPFLGRCSTRENAGR